MTSTDKPIHLTGKEYYDLLQKTRREALEEAAKAVCPHCRRGLPLVSLPKYFWHQEPGGLLECDANAIHKLITVEDEQGQGQTTQAEPVEKGNEGYTEQELKCAGCMGPCGQCNS